MSLVKSAAAILAETGHEEPDHAAGLNLLNPDDELLYAGEAAKLLGVTVRRINQLANSGQLPYRQVFAGCKRRYLQSDVLALRDQRIARTARGG